MNLKSTYLFLGILLSLFSSNCNSSEVKIIGNSIKAEQNEPSIYDLKATLIDQNNQQIPLNVYKGHPVVMSMFYATCDYSCPLLLNALKKMEKNINPNILPEIRFLLVSIDPENDTPKVLKGRFNHYAFSNERWKLAKSNDTSTREIAAILGVAYRKNPEGGMNHSSLVVLLNNEGMIIDRQEGIQNAVDHITTTINTKFK